GVALQGRKMHGFAGGAVDVLQIGLRAARQIDLQAGMPEIKDMGAEGIQAAARHLGSEAALDQGRQQMMAGRNVETGAGGKRGQRRLTASLGDAFQEIERAIDRLNAVTVSTGTRRMGLNLRLGQYGGDHWLILPGRQGNRPTSTSQAIFTIAIAIFIS